MKRELGLATVALLTAALVSGCADDPKKAGNPNARSCSSEYIVGSHLPKRACATVAEREALRKEGQEKMQNLHRQGRIGGSRTAGPN